MINNELFFAAEVLNTISEERHKNKNRERSLYVYYFTLNLFKRMVLLLITKNDDDDELFFAADEVLYFCVQFVRKETKIRRERD